MKAVTVIGTGWGWG